MINLRPSVSFTSFQKEIGLFVGPPIECKQWNPLLLRSKLSTSESFLEVCFICWKMSGFTAFLLMLLAFPKEDIKIAIMRSI